MNITNVKAELEQLKTENERLKMIRTRKLMFKVSAKGAISIYGLNSRFPVTLYKNQWKRLLEVGTDLETFIEQNADKLSVKE